MKKVIQLVLLACLVSVAIPMAPVKAKAQQMCLICKLHENGKETCRFVPCP